MSCFIGVDAIMKTLEELVKVYRLEWDAFVESLEEKDRKAFVALMHRVKRHAEGGSKIEYPNLFKSIESLSGIRGNSLSR